MRFSIKNFRFIIIVVVVACLSPRLALSAQCDQLKGSLQSQQQALRYLQQQNHRLEELSNGQLSPEFRIGEALNIVITDRLAVANAIAELKRDPITLKEAPTAFSDCPEQKKIWQDQQRQIDSLTGLIQKRSLHLLSLPRETRLTLTREIQQWEMLYQLEQEILSWADTQSDSKATALAESIIEWIDYWRNSMRIWLTQLMEHSLDDYPLGQIWYNTMQVPSPNAAIPWANVDLSSTVEINSWQRQLSQAHAALIREASKWRNQRIWNLGWSAFFKDLINPRQFWQHLSFELRYAPFNIVDTLSRPFIRSYYQEMEKGDRGELLSSWFVQLVLLAAAMSGLFRLASYAPRQLSQLQRASLGQLENRGMALLKNGLFWFLKPNAPWIVVLLGAYLCVHFVPENWTILALILPLGSFYAAHCAIRVILEWMISRTYTRTEQFVASHTAIAQTKDARTLAWIWVAASLVVYMVLSTGGGYLMFISLILWVITLWLSFYGLMSRYPDGIARFLLFVAGRGKSRKVEPAAAQQWWLRIIWPLLFVLAHFVDVIRSTHQKLLVFDTYRTLSIKVIRMRIAAEQKDDESGEVVTDEEPPDLSYSEWMLREEGVPWIEVTGLEKVTAPIKHWANNNPDDNVLLIVGDQGSGKSSLVRHLCEQWKDHPISELKIPAKTTDPAAVFPLIAEHLGSKEISSISELAEYDQTLSPQIVVIEDSHNLFLSEVGKLDAYRALNQCLNAHLQNIFWIVVMHSHSWTYLNCVFNRELRFSNIFSMPRWSPSDIRKLILSRHQGSRRRLSYNELLLSASAGNESSSVRAANSRVFNILWEQSGGTPKVAISLWLNAARSKDRTVEIGVPEKPQSAQLKGIRDDLCFIYAAIITHHALNSAEIMEVTHYPEAIVRHALKQGSYQGMLIRDSTKRYRIHPLWQGTLFNVLASRNMLWT